MRSCLWNERMIGHSRHRIDFQEPSARLVDHEIDACDISTTNSFINRTRCVCNFRLNFRWKHGIQDVLRVSSFVFRAEVIKLLTRHNFNHRQKISFENSHSDLATNNEFLRHQSWVFDFKFRASRSKLRSIEASSNTNARSIINRLDDHRHFQVTRFACNQDAGRGSSNTSCARKEFGTDLVHCNTRSTGTTSNIGSAICFHNFL